MARTKGAKRSRTQPNRKKAKPTATTKSPNKQATPATSPLLDLAPELRNAICRYVVVSDKPVKVQSQRSRRKGHHHFTMIPGLTLACKQLRLESQRIFLEGNDFEIQPEMMNELGSKKPLSMFATMHHNVGLDLQTLQATIGIKKRVRGDLFQLETSFTLSRVEGGLSITNQIFSGTYLGRTVPGRAVPRISVCGCFFTRFALGFSKGPGVGDVIQFLEKYQTNRWVSARSCKPADMERRDEVVYHGEICEHCRQQGRIAIPFR
jgi:hypothetical protein